MVTELKRKLCQHLIDFLQGPWMKIEEESGFAVYQTEEGEFIFTEPVRGDEHSIKRYYPLPNGAFPYPKGVGFWEPPESQTLFWIHTHPGPKLPSPSLADVMCFRHELEINSRISQTQQCWNPISWVVSSSRRSICQFQLPPRFAQISMDCVWSKVLGLVGDLYLRRYPWANLAKQDDFNEVRFEMESRMRVWKEDENSVPELIGHDYPRFAQNRSSPLWILEKLGCEIRLTSISKFLQLPEESLLMPTEIDTEIDPFSLVLS